MKLAQFIRIANHVKRGEAILNGLNVDDQECLACYEQMGKKAHGFSHGLNCPDRI